MKKVIFFSLILVVPFFSFFMLDEFIYENRLTDNEDKIDILDHFTLKKIQSSEIIINDSSWVLKSNLELVNAKIIDSLGNYQGIIINGLQQGFWRCFYDNGMTKVELNYLDGNGTNDGPKVAELILRFENLLKQGEYIIPPHGIVKEFVLFYENGQKKYEFYTNKKGNLHGSFERWYENGEYFLKSNYNNGELDGAYNKWYESGIISEKSNYTDGKLDWLEKFDFDGDLISNDNYKFQFDYIPYDHSNNFGALLCQSNNGEIVEFSKLCSEFLNKIARTDEIKNQSPTQLIIGMMNDPTKFSKVPMMKISNDKLKEILNTKESLVSYATFFDKEGNYILKEEIEIAYSIKPIYRGEYENDIIFVDENVNICFTIYNGGFLRFFPLPNDPNNAWYSSEESSFFLSNDSVFVSNIMKMYFNSLNSALDDNNWSLCDSVVMYISGFQDRHYKN